MKKRILLIFSSFILLAAAIGFFSWEQYQYTAPMPKPSTPGGYYDSPFTLELTVPRKGNIYYTTDGSTPTPDSARYVDGIEIKDRSGEPNIYHAVRNVVREAERLTVSNDPVDKGTVVRAVFINEHGVVSDILTQTYFVGIQPPEQGYSLSLVFEYDDLFGPDGLYVTGKEYDEWLLAGDTSVLAPLPNFEKQIEAAAVAEFMDASGFHLIQPIGLRLQGASARHAQMKRFTILARNEYGGSSLFDAELFDGIRTHSVMLKKALPDAIVPDLVTDRAVGAQRSVPVRVYLNGEYWYDSFMLERYDEQYFRQHFGVDDRVRVKNGVVDEESAAAADTDLYAEFMGYVQDTDFSDSREWERFQEKADVQSYIDCIVTNYYFCNVDFDDYHNYVLWRSPSLGNSAYEDMRWRWCIYDIDVIDWVQYSDHYIGNTAAINTFSGEHSFDINRNILYRALRPNADFQKQFVLTFMDMVNNNFAPANVEKVLLKYGYDLDWCDGFFRERPKYAVQHLSEEFDLTGTLETVTIYANDPGMGTVTVNTSVIDLTNGPWSGQYFTDYPITVTATPGEGFRFVGWKGGSSEAAITVPVDGGITLEAVFAEE